jgi:Domain of unknown function (DUF4407)
MIRKFLLFCSGADSKILLKDSNITDRYKYEAIGSNILLTAILSALSGGYAFFIVFSSTILSSSIGLLWGITIFNLNRFSSLNISNNRDSSKKFLLTIPGIMLASLIGLMNAKPIELRLFEREIDAQIASSIDKKSGQIVENHGLLSRLSALEEISQKEPLVERTRLLITLIFVLVEVSPILLLLLSQPGVYEAVVKTLERRALEELEIESQLQRDLRISKIKVHETTIKYLENQIFSGFESPDFRDETHASIIMRLKDAVFKITQVQLSGVENFSTAIIDKDVDETEKAISKNHENESIMHSSQSQIDGVEISHLLGESYQQIIQDLKINYSSELKAKEREIGLYQEYSIELEKLSERLASQPIVINSEQQILDK